MCGPILFDSRSKSVVYCGGREELPRLLPELWVPPPATDRPPLGREDPPDRLRIEEPERPPDLEPPDPERIPGARDLP